MKTMRRHLLYAVVPALAIAFYLSVGLAAHMPPSIGRPLWKFGYCNLTISPSNGEPYGVYVNREFSPTERLSIAVNDGQERHYFTKPAGDDHRHAALQKFFHLRVNAPNDKEATRLLREFFAERGFRGTIGETVIFAHGEPASPRIGLSKMGDDLFGLLSKHRPTDGQGEIAFVSCEVAKGDEGRHYIQRVADEYGLRVAASERKIQWHFWVKWFKAFEGERNYEIEEGHWVVASPGEREPRRLQGSLKLSRTLTNFPVNRSTFII